MKGRKCFECGGPHLARDCPTKGSKGPVKSIEEALQPVMKPFFGCVTDPGNAPRRPRPRPITLADFPVKFVTKVKNSFEILAIDEDRQRYRRAQDPYHARRLLLLLTLRVSGVLFVVAWR